MFLAYMASDLDQSMQAFFRGQIVLGLGFGALMIAVFALLGVHFALLLGIVLGIWEIIPVIGPTIGFIPVLVAVGIDGMDLVPGNRLMQLTVVFIVFQGLQWLKDNIVAPRYIGNVIGLHPVVIFLAIMIGARLDGMLGIIFALPAACAINVFMTHWNHNPHRVMEQGVIDAAPQTSEPGTGEIPSQDPVSQPNQVQPSV
jgi:predicted PurR-regulated permease PerM